MSNMILMMLAIFHRSYSQLVIIPVTRNVNIKVDLYPYALSLYEPGAKEGEIYLIPA